MGAGNPRVRWVSAPRGSGAVPSFIGVLALVLSTGLAGGMITASRTGAVPGRDRTRRSCVRDGSLVCLSSITAEMSSRLNGFASACLAISAGIIGPWLRGCAWAWDWDWGCRWAPGAASRCATAFWWEPFGAVRGRELTTGTGRGASFGATPASGCDSLAYSPSGVKFSSSPGAGGLTRPMSSASWPLGRTGRVFVNLISPTFSLVEPWRRSPPVTSGLRRVTRNLGRLELIRLVVVVLSRKGAMDMKSPRSGPRHPEFSTFVESDSASFGGLILAPIGFCSVQS
jgi:hypothetical protein